MEGLTAAYSIQMQKWIYTGLLYIFFLIIPDIKFHSWAQRWLWSLGYNYYNLQIWLSSGNGQTGTLNPICEVRIVFSQVHHFTFTDAKFNLPFYYPVFAVLRSALILPNNDLLSSGKLPHYSSPFPNHLYWAEQVSDPSGTPVQLPIYFFPLFAMLFKQKIFNESISV